MEWMLMMIKRSRNFKDVTLKGKDTAQIVDLILEAPYAGNKIIDLIG